MFVWIQVQVQDDETIRLRSSYRRQDRYREERARERHPEAAKVSVDVLYQIDYCHNRLRFVRT